MMMVTMILMQLTVLSCTFSHLVLAAPFNGGQKVSDSNRARQH